MNTRDFQLAAAAVARNAPKDWDDFLRAFQAYNQAVIQQLVSSPPETLQVAQGRAKMLGEVLRLMEESKSVAGQIEKGKVNGNRQSRNFTG